MRPCCLLAALALTATALPAEDGVPDAKKLFQDLDQNHDGKLAAAEIPEGQSRFFDRLLRIADKDKDGELTQDEFTQAHQEDAGPGLPLNGLGGQGPRGGNPDQIFDRLDRNHDGKLAKEEIPEPMRDRLGPLFERLGKDTLSKDDLRGFGRRMGPPGGFGMRGMPGRPRFLQELDANQDGRLSKEELAKAAEKFDALDNNGDGQLDPQELMGMPERGGPFAEMDGRRLGGANGDGGRSFFERMDRNGDGKVTKDELPPRMQERFDDLDQNGDGALTQEEIQASFRGRFGNRPEGGRPGGPGRPDSDRPRRPPAE
jgi:Ca2+-binding EF-hand superfamily protein